VVTPDLCAPVNLIWPCDTFEKHRRIICRAFLLIFLHKRTIARKIEIPQRGIVSPGTASFVAFECFHGQPGWFAKLRKFIGLWC
jgi:hypothetical protein